MLPTTNEMTGLRQKIGGMLSQQIRHGLREVTPGSMITARAGPDSVNLGRQPLHWSGKTPITCEVEIQRG